MKTAYSFSRAAPRHSFGGVAVVVLLSAQVEVSACPYLARRSRAGTQHRSTDVLAEKDFGDFLLPDGHPDIKRMLSAETGTAFSGDDLSDTNLGLKDPTMTVAGGLLYQSDDAGAPDYTKAPLVKAMHDLAVEMDEDVCWWSMQQLPPPTLEPNDEDIDLWTGPLPGPNGHVYKNGESPLTWGDASTKRAQDLVEEGGSVVWAGASMGKHYLKGQCKSLTANSSKRLNDLKAAGRDALGDIADCDTDFIDQMTVPLATSSLIFRIKKDNPKEFYDTLHQWRTTQSGHLPHMQSDLVYKKGWGTGNPVEGTAGAGSFGKAVRCSEIPTEYMYKSLVRGDTKRLPTSTVSVLDEAYLKWTKLCNRLQVPGLSYGIGPTADCPANFVNQQVQCSGAMPASSTMQEPSVAVQITPSAGFTNEGDDESTVTITVVGNRCRWFGIGFGATSMGAGDIYTLMFTAAGSPTAMEYSLGAYQAGTQLAQKQASVVSDTVDKGTGTRTVVLQRKLKGLSAKHFDFPKTDKASLDVIWAYGNDAYPSSSPPHTTSQRGTKKIQVEVSVNAPGHQVISGGQPGSPTSKNEEPAPSGGAAPESPSSNGNGASSGNGNGATFTHVQPSSPPSSAGKLTFPGVVLIASLGALFLC